jgi:hypothetical protein
MIWTYLTEAPDGTSSGVITWTGNGKIVEEDDQTWSSIWRVEVREERFKGLKYHQGVNIRWREWKLAIHMSEHWSLILPLFMLVFYSFYSYFLCFSFSCLFPPFSYLVFYCHSILSFSHLFLSLFFWLPCVFFLAYPNFLELLHFMKFSSASPTSS